VTDRRNLVLLSIDSLRADHCGFLNAEWDLTPTLDRIAEDGVVYENAIAPGPRTPSSMPDVFTGEIAPTVASAEGNWDNRWERIRRHLHHHQTIAERFRDRGYTTVGLTANPWTWGKGFDAGFDEFIELRASGDGTENVTVPLVFRLLEGAMGIGDLGARFNWHNKREWFAQWPQHYRTIAKRVREAGEPFFVWIFLLDPHLPYIVPKEFRSEATAPGMYYAAVQQYRRDSDDTFPAHVRRRLKRAYRDTVRSVDSFVDRFWSGFGGEDSVMLLHSDHGEAFGEHGTFGHESAVYEENLHVPLVLHNTEPDTRVSETISLRKIPELAVDAATGDGTFDPRQYTTDGFVYSGTEADDAHALRGCRWKYMLNGGAGTVYDLSTDPEERRGASSRSNGVAEERRGASSRSTVPCGGVRVA